LLDLPATAARIPVAAGGGEAGDDASPLDVPAFLRRQE
jgi:hypothetical protein